MQESKEAVNAIHYQKHFTYSTDNSALVTGTVRRVLILIELGAIFVWTFLSVHGVMKSTSHLQDTSHILSHHLCLYKKTW